MALTEEQRSELADNQFVSDGSAAGALYVRHLPCDTGIYLGENPVSIDKSLAHLPECPNPDGPADTFRKERPWPKGTDAQEATKEEWLSRIKGDPQATDADYNAAVSILVDPLIPTDEANVDHLIELGYVVDSNGLPVARFR
ncbi:hypothetical protein [Mycobacterium avium]|uniref:hypothetical protein n=1 Tax=Mycobacterium avium TaxID=1764 RepID=UPI001CC5EDA8|nr:hypothetical protein [Mycobacterium avium]MBZ4518146.1 hypothetical protein [Mycobacterium avium subsp. hominissuis]MBZ4527928.1 hypothetical protein [Mycobacterium avium subsp. hominissuis]MBZ4547229.1 hypothetical protein [Mycobacterium avium subsp. hominissuis]MBZ4556892.1 hypothetical protein [Mycobacterium avium subsp. hominissuis]MBZ4566498.1 hypothetical protein [Mycobacterium avium subsp. hominissuis]